MSAYVVAYGRSGFLGRFQGGAAAARGDAVVVRTPRGTELGEVLGPAGEAPSPWPAGDLLRPATADDRRAADDLAARATGLADAASALAGELGLPLTVLDAEMPLGGGELILHVVRWAGGTADALCERLAAGHGVRVTLLDLTRQPAPAAGGCSTCGSEKGGCSSCGTGGGCSSGSCSRGAAKTAEGMTAYFADLRRQMESASAQRTPLL